MLRLFLSRLHKDMSKISQYVVLAVSVLLGAFFIYKGLTKHWLSPCKVYSPESTIPQAYIALINSLCHSGFLKMVGAMEILTGALLLVPRTRLLGAVLLAPIIFNIFFIHLFLDNRPEELVETGIPLAATVGVLLYHWRDLSVLFNPGRA
jgi:uncharacterized membrane protein YphA (DoxX/SURF4 family)